MEEDFDGWGHSSSIIPMSQFCIIIVLTINQLFQVFSLSLLLLIFALPESEVEAKLAAMAEVDLKILEDIKEMGWCAHEGILVGSCEQLWIKEPVFPDDQVHDLVVSYPYLYKNVQSLSE